MNIFVLGVSHHNTPLEIREKLSTIDFSEPAFNALLHGGIIKEAVPISTCNRLEILGVTSNLALAKDKILQTLALKTNIELVLLEKHIYLHLGLNAIRHMFRVASSLDSLIIGEPQILGQIKDAFRNSLNNKSAGLITSQIMHKTFRAAKRVRTETLLACGAVSVSYAAVELIKKYCFLFKNLSILLIGAGEMAELAAIHLKPKEPANLFIVNRSFEAAKILAETVGAKARSWPHLKSVLGQVDVVISAARVPEPILNYDILQEARAANNGSNLLLIDISLPRSIDPNVEALPWVRLKNIDDLKDVVRCNIKNRQAEAIKAEAIVEEETTKFSLWLERLSSFPILTEFTQKAEQNRRLELNKTLGKGNFSQEQAEMLDLMTKSLVRRILHDPIHFIKAHGSSENYTLDVARKILGLDKDND